MPGFARKWRSNWHAPRKCWNNLTAARDVLCQALLRSEPGLLTAQLQCELADICIKLGDNKQAVTICSQILNSSVPDEFA